MVVASPVIASQTALSRIPTTTLLRSFVLTSLMTRKWVMSPSLVAIGAIARSKSRILNPDRNPFLNQVLRWSIFDHFCPGSTETQVSRTITRLKKMGFHGIILGFSKEIVVDPNDVNAPSEHSQYNAAHVKVVEKWRDENLRTLRMVAPGDFIAVKLTGAGPLSVDALQALQPMPPVLSESMDQICAQAKKQGSRLWIDAEQQIFQKGIDNWTIDLMRKHNGEGALVYNTIQGYLKGARANAERHIALAAEEGWTLAIKLVRGAYIEHEVRSLIHDTKQDTDRSYDDIADMIISQKLPSGAAQASFPRAALMLASHNADSARRAIALQARRIAAGRPTISLECAQILGMADELSCELLQDYDRLAARNPEGRGSLPKIYKCFHWGSVAECMHYLHRRAIENRGSLERTQHMADALRQELHRRFFRLGIV